MTTTAPRLNSCHNQTRPTAGMPLVVQDGWYTATVPGTSRATRLPRLVTVPFVMSTDCRYDKQIPDPGCKGCFQAPVDAEFDPDFREVATQPAVQA